MSFSIEVEGDSKEYIEFQSASVTRSINQPTGIFNFTTPGPFDGINIRAEDAVTIRADNAEILRGKLDKIENKSDAGNSSRSYNGKSSMGAVVKSSARLDPSEWKNVNAGQIIQNLLQPFGITPRFDIQPQGNTDLTSTPGDTVWDLINKLLTRENLFAYEVEPKILVITRAPTSGSVASLQYGTQQVLKTEKYSLDTSARFALYTVIGEAAPPLTFRAQAQAKDTAIKTGELIIQLSGSVDDARCQQVANYEAQIRAARSLNFAYRVPNWYNNGGQLWEPNVRVNIEDEENQIFGEHLLTTVHLAENQGNEWGILTFAAPEAYTAKPPEPPAGDSLFNIAPVSKEDSSLIEVRRSL